MSRPVCIDHLALPVSDLASAHAFYAAALGALGWEEIEVQGAPTWGPPGAEDFSIEEGSPPPRGMHIAFLAESPEHVRAFHRAALGAGGRDNGPPGPRPVYHPGYYAAFVLDPDGNNVEAVFHDRSHVSGAPGVSSV